MLFIIVEKNVYADAIGEYLWKTKEFGFKQSEVLVIHTDEEGEVTKKDLEKACDAARDIDKAVAHAQACGESRGEELWACCRTLADGLAKHEITGKLWVVQADRIREYQPDRGED
ncbi:hypothetical protein [Nitrospira sp. Kam-Ns4a]